MLQEIIRLWRPLPGFIRRLFLRRDLETPAERRERFGTVALNQSRIILNLYRRGHLTPGDELIIIYE